VTHPTVAKLARRWRRQVAEATVTQAMAGTG
jgi:hypothetical protein